MATSARKHNRRARIAIIIVVVIAAIIAAIIGKMLIDDYIANNATPAGEEKAYAATPLNTIDLEHDAVYTRDDLDSAEGDSDTDGTADKGNPVIYDYSDDPDTGPAFFEFEGENYEIVDWDYWDRINPDVIGWVTVPGTNIDYPIVQAHADNPTYYLHHDVYKNYNYCGCPYLDYRCAEDGLDSYNATIFGHHLNNNTMFSMFSNFSNRSYALSHQAILLQTRYDIRVLDVAWVKVVNANTYQNYMEFPSALSYQEWYRSARDEATLVLDGAVPQHDYMFVTCSYTTWNNERTIVVANVRGETRVEG